MTTTARTTCSTKETAAQIRKHLRAQWPTVKFSVRCQRGTASAWIGITWTDGPTEAQVRVATGQFKGATFNGMTDSYDQLPDRLVSITPGELPQMVRYYCDGITTQRTHSDTATRAIAAELAAANDYLAEHLTPDVLDTLTYNDLHRGRFYLAQLPDNRAVRYRGDNIRTPHHHDVGAAIAAALITTDHTT